ncbi:MAG: aminotransferase class I/II-fold pyridoxal phosphate-dependent enzyme [Planctomycetota bacterium]
MPYPRSTPVWVTVCATAADRTVSGMDLFRRRLAALRSEDRLRGLRTLDGVRGLEVADGDARLVNFSSNDYLNLSQDARVIAAAAAAAREFGTGSRASRLISGSLAVHRDLEADLAAWLGMERALVFPAGYMADLGLMAALGREGSVAIDRLGHASLYDGLVLGGGRYRRFPHNQPGRITFADPGAPLRAVVTESIFSMTGDLAPLAGLRAAAARRDALLVVDEAHALGVRGPTGAGLLEETGIRAEAVTITLSKALGGQGGAIAGSADLIDYLVNTSRSFIYTTGLSPMVAAAVRAAVAIIRIEGGALRARLARNVIAVRAALAARGLAVPAGTGSHIIPIHAGTDAVALAVAACLREYGILAVAVRPPTVPRGRSLIRLSVTAGHTPAHIERLERALAAAVRRCPLPAVPAAGEGD